MAKTAEKTDKPAVKSAPKVFDITHPGKSAPSASSRPIIVTNRAVMQDPMVAASDTEEPLPSKPMNKITLQPLTDAEKKSALHENDDKAELPDFSALTQESDKKPVDEPEAAAPADDGPVENTDEKTAPKDKEEAAPVEQPQADTAAGDTPATEDAAVSEESADGAPAEDGANTASKAEADTAALEAKIKQEEAINQLVDSREFYLPINAVERHRSKVISLLGLLLIVLLAVVLADLLLDSGVVHISGVHPVTHFFSTYQAY